MLKAKDLTMSHWMFNCRDVSKKVSDSMDVNLPFHYRLQVKIHLLMCKYCNRLKNQLLILRKTARLEDLPEDEIYRAQSLSKETRERIKRAMRDLVLKTP